MEHTNIRRRYERELPQLVTTFRRHLALAPSTRIPTAIVLDDEWGHDLPFELEADTRLVSLGWPLSELDDVEGCARTYQIGRMQNHLVILLRGGSVRMNEATFNPAIKLAVRAQIQILLEMGVKHLVLATKVTRMGMIKSSEINVDVIDGLIDEPNEVMPLFRSEIVRPSDVLDKKFFRPRPSSMIGYAAHVYQHGPHFNPTADSWDCVKSNQYFVDVSTDIKPECCIAALPAYRNANVRVSPLGFVENGTLNPLNDQERLIRAQQARPMLTELIMNVLTRIFSKEA